MDRATPSGRTNNSVVTTPERADEQAGNTARFQQTLAGAQSARPIDRAPALLDTLAILHTLPQSAIPDALTTICVACHDIPEEHAGLVAEVTLRHFSAMTGGCSQNKASLDAKKVAESMIHAAVHRSPAYQAVLLCKLAGVAADLALPMFSQFIIQQLTAPLVLPHCSDAAYLVNAAAMLTPHLPEKQQLDQLKLLYRLANEQGAQRLPALEALQLQSNYLRLTLANVDFLQTLNQDIYRLRLAEL